MKGSTAQVIKSEVERLREELAKAEAAFRIAAVEENSFILLPPFVEDYYPYSEERGGLAAYFSYLVASQPRRASILQGCIHSEQEADLVTEAWKQNNDLQPDEQHSEFSQELEQQSELLNDLVRSGPTEPEMQQTQASFSSHIQHVSSHAEARLNEEQPPMAPLPPQQQTSVVPIYRYEPYTHVVLPPVHSSYTVGVGCGGYVGIPTNMSTYDVSHGFGGVFPAPPSMAHVQDSRLTKTAARRLRRKKIKAFYRDTDTGSNTAFAHPESQGNFLHDSEHELASFRPALFAHSLSLTSGLPQSETSTMRTGPTQEGYTQVLSPEAEAQVPAASQKPCPSARAALSSALADMCSDGSLKCKMASVVVKNQPKQARNVFSGKPESDKRQRTSNIATTPATSQGPRYAKPANPTSASTVEARRSASEDAAVKRVSQAQTGETWRKRASSAETAVKKAFTMLPPYTPASNPVPRICPQLSSSFFARDSEVRISSSLLAQPTIVGPLSSDEKNVCPPLPTTPPSVSLFAMTSRGIRRNHLDNNSAPLQCAPQPVPLETTIQAEQLQPDALKEVHKPLSGQQLSNNKASSISRSVNGKSIPTNCTLDPSSYRPLQDSEERPVLVSSEPESVVENPKTETSTNANDAATPKAATRSTFSKQSNLRPLLAADQQSAPRKATHVGSTTADVEKDLDVNPATNTSRKTAVAESRQKVLPVSVLPVSVLPVSPSPSSKAAGKTIDKLVANPTQTQKVEVSAPSKATPEVASVAASKKASPGQESKKTAAVGPSSQQKPRQTFAKSRIEPTSGERKPSHFTPTTTIDENVLCPKSTQSEGAVEPTYKLNKEVVPDKAPTASAAVADDQLAEVTCALRGATQSEALQLLRKPELMRNIAVVAHVDAGKSTLSDVLLKQSGLVSDAASCALDSTEEERSRGITIKAAAVSLCYRGCIIKDNGCVVNLIDCPGHVDFSSEVTSSLRVADGSFIVVDSVEGMQVQTEAVLKLCLEQKVVPALIFNKLDRLIMQLHLSPEEVYERLYATVVTLETKCDEYCSESLATSCKEALSRNAAPSPEQNSVVFASGLQGWGFSLDTFARLWGTRFGVSPEILRKKLWGNCYFNSKTRRFTTSSVGKDGTVHARAFNRFVLEPIYQIKDACVTIAANAVRKDCDLEPLTAVLSNIWSTEACNAACAALKAVLKHGLGENGAATLFNAAMKALLPAAHALVGMASSSLPSPKVAQAYRADILVGDDNPQLRAAVAACDPAGPVVAYVTKMVPVHNTWNFHSFGRVFSGTVRAGRSVVAIESSSTTRVQATVLLMGSKEERVASVSAGCPSAFVGIADSIAKCSTLVDPSLAVTSGCQGMRSVRHQLTPVVRAAVECVNSGDRLHLIKAMKWLEKSDPLVQCFFEAASREAVIAAGGELHLEVCISALKSRINGPPGNETGNRSLKVSPPTVPYRETVTSQSPSSCLAKTSNKLNRIYATASPLADDILEAIESGAVRTPADAAQHGLKNVWCLSMDEAGPNVLVNSTSGLPLIGELRANVVNSFKDLMMKGPLCEEKCRGVMIEITDALVHTDPAHRGPAEVCPASKRAMAAAMLTANPSLYEPILECTVSTTLKCAGTVQSIFPKRRGLTVDEHHTNDSVIISCHLPVQTSFGITQELRGSSGGRSSFTGSFSHWAPIPENLVTQSTNLTREQKRLPRAMTAAQLTDKL
ncbi:Elongation factor 2 [Diplonema papillatum]|nr:Elongation factor 2 [Diplonema papillatum]